MKKLSLVNPIGQSVAISFIMLLVCMFFYVVYIFLFEPDSYFCAIVVSVILLMFIAVLVCIFIMAPKDETLCIRQIKVQGNYIEIEYEKQFKVHKYKSYFTSINADVYITERLYGSSDLLKRFLPFLDVYINVTDENGTVSKFKHADDCLDYSIKLLGFLKNIECFSYKLINQEVINFDNRKCKNMEVAVQEYILNDKYNFLVFRYYDKIISYIACLIFVILILLVIYFLIVYLR